MPHFEKNYTCRGYFVGSSPRGRQSLIRNIMRNPTVALAAATKHASITFIHLNCMYLKRILQIKLIDSMKNKCILNSNLTSVLKLLIYSLCDSTKLPLHHQMLQMQQKEAIHKFHMEKIPLYLNSINLKFDTMVYYLFI